MVSSREGLRDGGTSLSRMGFRSQVSSTVRTEEWSDDGEGPPGSYQGHVGSLRLQEERVEGSNEPHDR